MKTIFALAVLAAVGQASDPIPSPTANPINVGLAMRVPYPPQPVVRSDGRRLSYELHVTNYTRRPMRLLALELVDADDRSLIATIEGPALAAISGGQWVPADTADRATIAAGGRAVLFIDQPTAAAPKRIMHRFRYALADGAALAVEGQAIALAATAVPELAPPLKGGPWATVYAPEMEFGHRRYVYAIDGEPRVPGRFAIDFFHADRKGPKPTRYAADPGFGAEVLAVADAIVAEVRDDVPDPAGPDDKPSPKVEDGAGNFIALDLGDGRFAFYEHLRRGVRVKRGDRVKRGQVIGTLGATGHVGGAHLHFHIGDARDALRAEGVPFTLTRFDRVGGYASIKDFDARAAWAPAPATRVERAMPAPNIVVRFPG